MNLRYALWTFAILCICPPKADAQGLYTSFALAYSTEEITASTAGINHPTRCDRALYPDPSQAPADGACLDNAVRQIGGETFDLGGAFSGAASLGYAWERLRVEAQFLSRAHEGQTLPFATPGDNPALQGKLSEWSPDNPPNYRISDFSSRQLFLNLYYDFRTASRWTPYVGAGVGQADVQTRYTVSFQRRTLADGYVAATGGDVDNPEPWQIAAAGSLSLLDTHVQDRVFGYQVIVGVERELRERVSAFFSVRWLDIDDIGNETIWETTRSHKPVQADGVTPFVGRQEIGQIGGLTATFGIRVGL